MKLPNGWSTKRLKDVGDCITGLTYSPEDVTDENQGILVLRSSNVQNGRLAFYDNVYVNAVIPEDSLTKEGDILICVRNGSRALIGKSALIRGDGVGVAHGAFMTIFRSKDSAYIHQLFQTPKYFKQVHSHLGATINSINSGNLYEFEFPFPPSNERAAIVNILSTWDSAIEKTERLIEVKRLRYRGMVNRLIVKRSHEKGWRHIQISQIADRVQRQSDGGDYPLLTISAASGFVRQEDRYSRYMAGESAKTYTLLRKDEFAYNKGNSLRYEFGCVFQLADHDAALVPSVYVCFKLRNAISASYLKHIFGVDYLKPQLRALVKTGVRNNGLLNIRPDEFMGTTVPVPDICEQERIASILDDAQSEIELLTDSLDALRNQKRGLMQKLLTGMWRIHVNEEVAA